MDSTEYVVIPFNGDTAKGALERIESEFGFVGAVLPAFEELTEAFYVAFMNAQVEL